MRGRGWIRDIFMASQKLKKKDGQGESESIVRVPSFFYAKIAWIALAVAVVIAGVVLTTASRSAVVSVTLKSAESERDLTVRVVQTTPGQTDATVAQPVVVGEIVESIGTARATKPIKATQSVIGRAEGTLTIVNTTGRSQPLVATTRFLSPKGVLFRLVRGVTVPARSRVNAEVRADQPGAEGDVGSTRWRIPGLSSSLQSLIYGVSEGAMTGGLREARRVDEVDIAEVVAKAEIEATKNAEKALSVAPNLFRFSRTTATIRTLNAKAGQNVAELSADVRATVTHVLVDPAAAKTAVRQFLESDVAREKRDLVDVAGDVSSFELEKIFREEKAAEIHGTMKLTTRPSGSGLAQELQGAVTGLAREQVRVQLLGREDVADASVRITPPWLWTLPSRSDKIRVLIR